VVEAALQSLRTKINTKAFGLRSLDQEIWKSDVIPKTDIDTYSPASTADTPKNGAELLVRALEREGVDMIFGYPGGAIMPVYDALTGSPITHILTRHEQGAAFAAEGYARVSGRVGVCLATSGPGLTNLVTGIADAYADSIPVVYIAGQVAAPFMGTDAFQEVDGFGITMPIVKHSFIIRSTEEIPDVISEAMYIAASGRPGPVVIELPKDIGASAITEAVFVNRKIEERTADTRAVLAAAEEMIRDAEKPLLYVGGGVAIADACNELTSFVDRTGIPAVATLKGLGCIPTDHPSFIGMLGMHGLKAANMAVQESDLLIALGARFDDRVTGNLASFAPHARVIHMDVDPAEMGKLRAVDLSMTGDIGRNLTAMNPTPIDISTWQDWIAENKTAYAPRYDAPGEGIYAPALLNKLSHDAGRDAIFTCDVGQHQMWVAQHCRFTRPEGHLTSGGLGAMGFGMPAGIGAKLAAPDDTVITVTGDGSIMMNIQELATLNRYGIKLKIVLLDNSCLGMVRQWQTIFFDGNHSEVDLSDNPDFAAVAKAFGIESFAISRADEVQDGINRLLTTDGPVLMHVKINPQENVWPLVAPGASISDMMEEVPCQTP